MQTRQRCWRIEGVSTFLSTQEAIQATEAEIQRDLERLEDSTIESEPSLFQKKSANEESATDRRKGFRRGTKPPDEGMEAVLGLASLVIEAETRKRKRTLVKTAPVLTKPKEAVHPPAKPVKPVKEQPRKVAKCSPAPIPTGRMKPAKSASQTNTPFFPPVFPQQFPMPMFYPPMSLYQYQCFKYPAPGFFPQNVMSMYCGLQGKTGQSGVQERGMQMKEKNAMKHVAIAKMIQQGQKTTAKT